MLVGLLPRQTCALVMIHTRKAKEEKLKKREGLCGSGFVSDDDDDDDYFGVE